MVSLEFFMFFMFSPPALRQDLAELSQSRLGDSLARPWLRDGYENVKNIKNIENCRKKNIKEYTFLCFRFSFSCFSSFSCFHLHLSDRIWLSWARAGWEVYFFMFSFQFSCFSSFSCFHLHLSDRIWLSWVRAGPPAPRHALLRDSDLRSYGTINENVGPCYPGSCPIWRPHLPQALPKRSKDQITSCWLNHGIMFILSAVGII